MARLLGLLLLCTGLVLAQEEEEDESGISIDEVPEGPVEDEAKPGSKPEQRTTPFPAREPGKKVATVEVRKKVYAFPVPEDWVLIEEKSEKTELAFELLLPGSSKRAGLWLTRRDGGDPRSWPHRHAEWVLKEKPDRKTEVRTKPRPRAIDRHVLNGTDWIHAFFPFSVKGNQYLLEISCSAGDFPQAETDLLATVVAFKAKVEIWPPIPTTYEKSDEGVWLVARAPSVTASIAPLVKALRDAEKRFRRDHGPLPKGDAPMVVLVHASKAQGAKLDPKVGESSSDFHADESARRLYAIPFPRENREQEVDLARAASEVLFMAKYGDWRPDWIYWGEHNVAAAEARTGKPLPSLDEGFLNWYSTVRFHKLSELPAFRERDGQEWTREAFFYVAALREGKYRKQYKAFLEDYAETSDGLGAFERHLGSIDEDELIAATNQYVTTRIQEVKRKHENH